LVIACTSEEGSQQEHKVQAGSPDQRVASAAKHNGADATTPEKAAQDEEQERRAVGLGEVAKVDDFLVRVFDVRSQDTVYYIPRPRASPESRKSSSGKYVAIDYVAENPSNSLLVTQAEAALEDAQGNLHRQDASIESPAGGLYGMHLDSGQKRASTLFFEVPNGTTPERLLIRFFGEEVQVDLTNNERSKIPPEDYLHVYHTYFNQRANKESYRMLDPSSTQVITPREWLTSLKGLWGEQYLSLEDLRLVSIARNRAVFEADRAFYLSDGSVFADPVVQEMVREGEEWKLVVRKDLIDEILPVRSPRPEATTPESLPSEDRFDCKDFSTQAEAQAVLDRDPSYPYGLDEDENLKACESLPSSSGRTPPPESTSGSADLENRFRGAVEDYYWAVDREDWAYTYEHLDSQTKAMFTEEEWGLKNQWFADIEGLDLATMEVQLNGAPSDPVVSVTVNRTFKDGTSFTRNTYFVAEGGTWKHRLGEEEIGSFMPDASYREFVATQQGVTSDKTVSTSDLDQGEEDLREAVEAYYQAAGVGNWAYTYEYLDSETKSAFSKAEWFKKNQWFADNGSVTYHILAVNLNSALQKPVAQITLRLTDEYGSASVRNTFFVLEDGLWRHRFGREEYSLFMPEASYEEFVEAREGA
jgi:hypothetical protein